jgi:hypothetical protein
VTEVTLKQGDLVDFAVVRSDAEGTYHGAIYLNHKLLLIGEGRPTWDLARQDADAEEEMFMRSVEAVTEGTEVPTSHRMH